MWFNFRTNTWISIFQKYNKRYLHIIYDDLIIDDIFICYPFIVLFEQYLPIIEINIRILVILKGIKSRGGKGIKILDIFVFSSCFYI